MKLFYLFLILSFTFSCNTSKKNYIESSNNKGIERYPEALISNNIPKSSKFKLLSTKIEGNFIEFEVEHSGGCKEHDFKLIGEENISDSKPPKRKITLIDSTFDDYCKSIVRKKIKFSISILSDNAKIVPIELILSNTNESILYSYKK